MATCLIGRYALVASICWIFPAAGLGFNVNCVPSDYLKCSLDTDVALMRSLVVEASSYDFSYCTWEHCLFQQACALYGSKSAQHRNLTAGIEIMYIASLVLHSSIAALLVLG